MGSLISTPENSNEQSIDILQLRSDNIFINGDNILITLLQYHFCPDIKDECLKILNEIRLIRCVIKIFHHKTTIYGICIPHLLYECISKNILCDLDGRYYLKKID